MIQSSLNSLKVKIIAPSTCEATEADLHAAVEFLKKSAADSTSVGVYFDINLFAYSRPIKKAGSSSQNEFLVRIELCILIFRIYGFREHLWSLKKDFQGWCGEVL